MSGPRRCHLPVRRASPPSRRSTSGSNSANASAASGGFASPLIVKRSERLKKPTRVRPVGARGRVGWSGGFALALVPHHPLAEAIPYETKTYTLFAIPATFFAVLATRYVQRVVKRGDHCTAYG